MVMRNTPVERLKTAAKNWVRSARIAQCAYASGCAVQCWNFKSTAVGAACRCGRPAPCTPAQVCRSLLRHARRPRGCTAGRKLISRAARGLWPQPPNQRSRCALCGQPVQNLCLPWAQYIGVATIETQAAFLGKNMTKAAADISLTY